MKTNRPTFRSDEYADDSPDISAQKLREATPTAM